MQADWKKLTLQFKTPAGTSRGQLLEKDSYFLRLTEGDRSGIGEASLIPKLSPDDATTVPGRLEELCRRINSGMAPEDVDDLETFPAVKFALETATRDLRMGGQRVVLENDFTSGNYRIPVNGLIWMSDRENMFRQVEDRVDEGFSVIKLKIGALHFEEELELLSDIREHFPAGEIDLRLDANGAFAPEEAMSKLNKLAQFDIHSVEQPVKAGKWQEMARLCKDSPIPIALDEELIGIRGLNMKKKLLEAIKPQFLVLKMSLLGGFQNTEEWIEAADEQAIQWWLTSALESNIGLNAIAQFTATKEPTLPQGLGTGKLFSNNIESPLEIRNGTLVYNIEKQWEALEWSQLPKPAPEQHHR